MSNKYTKAEYVHALTILLSLTRPEDSKELEKLSKPFLQRMYESLIQEARS